MTEKINSNATYFLAGLTRWPAPARVPSAGGKAGSHCRERSGRDQDE